MIESVELMAWVVFYAWFLYECLKVMNLCCWRLGYFRYLYASKGDTNDTYLVGALASPLSMVESCLFIQQYRVYDLGRAL